MQHTMVIFPLLSAHASSMNSPSFGGKEYNDGGILMAPNTPGDALDRLFGRDSLLPVSCNELAYDEHGVSTGYISVNFTAAFGKRKRFLDLASSARGHLMTSKYLTIYVGDSVTDLLAMLDADIGILVGNDTSFERVASTFGVSIRPLVSVYEAFREGSDNVDELPRPLGRIYRVAHWSEIGVFLFGDSFGRPVPLPVRENITSI